MKTYKRSAAQGGFTLMEIMIVVVILALLAALIIPKLINKTSDAKIASAKTDIRTLETALGNYHLDNDAYPTTEEGLAALSASPSNAKHWKGPYIEHALTNDPWGNPYVYTSPGPTGQDYVITSYGASGQSGSTDNISSDSM